MAEANVNNDRPITEVLLIIHHEQNLDIHTRNCTRHAVLFHKHGTLTSVNDRGVTRNRVH